MSGASVPIHVPHFLHSLNLSLSLSPSCLYLRDRSQSLSSLTVISQPSTRDVIYREQ